MLFVYDSLKSAKNTKERTQIIQKAVDEAHEKQLGTVVIPSGTWEIATIEIKSGVYLRLEPNAVLLGCTDIELYRHFPDQRSGDRHGYHLIYADGASFCGITGPGIIDGQGEAFWNPPAPGKDWYRAREKRPSPLIEIRNCTDVLLSDFTVRNSPGWTIHPYCSDRVTIRGIKIENHLFGPNTDGIDVNGCRWVTISDCHIRCGDDAIILKATEDARSTEYVTVTNCVFDTGCAALGIGAETWRSIRFVTFSNCVVQNAVRMIQIIMWDGGIVENITYSNITGRSHMKCGVDRPIHLDIQEHQGENPELGKMRNLLFHNIICETRGRIIMTAQDGSVIENVTLRDVILDYPDVEDPTGKCKNPTSSQMSNFSPEARVALAAIIADNVHNLTIENVSTVWPEKTLEEHPDMNGLWCRNVRGCRLNSPALVPNRQEVKRVQSKNSDIHYS